MHQRLARRRLDRRGRPVADGARGPRRVPRARQVGRPVSVRSQPDRQAGRRDGRLRRDLLPALEPLGDRHDLRPRRGVPHRRRQGRALERRRSGHADRRRRHAARGDQGRRHARRRRDRRPRDRPLLGQAGRRRDAVGGVRRHRWPADHRRGSLARGRDRRRGVGGVRRHRRAAARRQARGHAPARVRARAPNCCTMSGSMPTRSSTPPSGWRRSDRRSAAPPRPPEPAARGAPAQVRSSGRAVPGAPRAQRWTTTLPVIRPDSTSSCALADPGGGEVGDPLAHGRADPAFVDEAGELEPACASARSCRASRTSSG